MCVYLFYNNFLFFLPNRSFEKQDLMNKNQISNSQNEKDINNEIRAVVRFLLCSCAVNSFQSDYLL